MTKRAIKRKSSVSDVLKDIQSRSIRNHEKRTTAPNINIIDEKLRDLDLSCFDFVDCDIKDVIFLDVDLRGSSFLESDIEHVKFIDCLVLDLQLPDSAKYITFSNCSPRNNEANKIYPSKIQEKILSLAGAAALLSIIWLPTEKLFTLTIMLAFIAIITVSWQLKK